MSSDSIVVRDLIKTFTRQIAVEGFDPLQDPLDVRRRIHSVGVAAVARRSGVHRDGGLVLLLRDLPITWHVDVLRYATIGLGQPSIVWLEGGAFLVFTIAAFCGALWALRQQ